MNKDSLYKCILICDIDVCYFWKYIRLESKLNFEKLINLAFNVYIFCHFSLFFSVKFNF